MTEDEFLRALAEANALLWFHARRLARRRDDVAEDLVQTAAAWLWANRAKAAGHPNPGGWFIQAGRWAMLRAVKAARRHQLDAFDPDAHADAFAAADPEPDEFGRLVELLPAEARELAERRFRDGRTWEELAVGSGITPEGMRYRLTAALARLGPALVGYPTPERLIH